MAMKHNTNPTHTTKNRFTNCCNPASVQTNIQKHGLANDLARLDCRSSTRAQEQKSLKMRVFSLPLLTFTFNTNRFFYPPTSSTHQRGSTLLGYSKGPRSKQPTNYSCVCLTARKFDLPPESPPPDQVNSPRQPSQTEFESGVTEDSIFIIIIPTISRIQKLYT